MPAVKVYAPGSTSNLGPGFDCLGVAFTGKGDTVAATPVDEAGVRVTEVSDPRIPLAAGSNTAAIAAAAVLRGRTDGGLELRIHKGLPLSGGMGGSAASAVAGAVAADAAYGLRLPRETLLEAALDAEAAVAGRHPDNVAPSLFGGAVLALRADVPGGFALTRFRVHPDVALVFVTPAYGVATSRARSVLPAEVARADAVAQAASLASLVLALERGDLELAGSVLADRIAEPRRLPLYPGYPEARAAGVAAGAAGVCVSGAGPTILALVAVERGARVGEAMLAAYAAGGMKAEAHLARVDVAGAVLVG